jgi:CRP/FNR family transcriptional regulator
MELHTRSEPKAGFSPAIPPVFRGLAPASPVQVRDSRAPAPWNPAAVFEPCGVPLNLERGSPVYTPGQAPAQLYWIAKGEVSLVRHTQDGRELTLEVHREGCVFGEQELLLGMPRRCEAVCRTDAKLRSLAAEHVRTLCRESAEFAGGLNRVLAERQGRLEARLEALLFKSAPGKVAQLLVDLAQAYGRPAPGGTLIDYPITHQEIGSLIGTTRETVSYAFMEFRQRGWIATQQRRTVVRDLGRLEAAALV